MVNTDRIEIDEGRISELIDEFHEADTRRERREIEAKVLSETVWKAPELGHNELVMTRRELEGLLSDLTEAVEQGDDHLVNMIHRKPSFLIAERNRTMKQD